MNLPPEPGESTLNKPNQIPRRRVHRDIVILLILTAAVATAVAALMHVSAPVAPARLQVLSDIIAGRSIAYSPYSVGYFEFSGYAIRISPRYGLVAAQGVLYILTVLFSYWTLLRMGARGAFPLMGGIAVALYPNLIVAIARFQDTGISCFLLSVFAWLVMRLRDSGLSPANAAISGALFGLTLLVRPNAFTLAPVAMFAAIIGRRLGVRDLVLFAGSIGFTVGILALGIMPVKGRFDVFDRYYGAYSFVAGTHEGAIGASLRDYNGEMSLPESLQKLGIPSPGLGQTSDLLASQYMETGLRYIHDHPFGYVVLELVKLLNLFRPDFRNVETSFIPPLITKALHLAIAAIFFVWLLLRYVSRRSFGIGDGFLLVPIAFVYLVPFLATGTDPRYRVPVDALFLLECVYCIELLRNNRMRVPAAPPRTVNTIVGGEA